MVGVRQSSVCQGPDVPKSVYRWSLVARSALDLVLDPAEGFVVFYEKKGRPLARLEG